MEVLGWSYAIRFRQIIKVSHGDRTIAARDWVPIGGHAKMLRGVQITADKRGIPAMRVRQRLAVHERE